jgi:hypothetical protein
MSLKKAGDEPEFLNRLLFDNEIVKDKDLPDFKGA